MDVSGVHIDGVPHWITTSIVVGVMIVSVLGALSAIGAFARNLLNSKLLKIAVKELTNNGGGSLKDSVEKSVVQNEDLRRQGADLKADLRKLDEKHDQATKLTNERLEAMQAAHNGILQDFAAVKQDVSLVKTEHADLKLTLARYIVHQADNDLLSSRLLKEEKALLEKHPATGGRK